MAGSSLNNAASQNKLRLLLAAFFFALAIPIAFLVSHAYHQLRWESFHQHRINAEELSSRIDTSLLKMRALADSRSFSDYSFFTRQSDSTTGHLRRSPLSTYPVSGELPGIIGYFQIGPTGEFTTPLIPADNSAAKQLQLLPTDYRQRNDIALALQRILSENQLVGYNSSRTSIDSAELTPIPTGQPDINDSSQVARRRTESSSTPAAAPDIVPRVNNATTQSLQTAPASIDSQQAFDQLNRPIGSAEQFLTPKIIQSKTNVQNKVNELNLDSFYEKKSIQFEKLQSAKTKEKRNLKTLNTTRTQDSFRLQEKEKSNISSEYDQSVNTVKNDQDLRIHTFENEVDPFELSLLNSGQFVLFRKVWRDQQRYIQGLLIDQSKFLRDVVEQRYRQTALSSMSSLFVAYQDSLLHTFEYSPSNSYLDSRGYSDKTQDVDGELLYRRRLSTPFNSVELIFKIEKLPAGPGANVLGWLTLAVAAVFLGGFYAMYRVGLRQLAINQQQHDFVSAVSHELKTPLTSIRLYGEMLKEGWADEEKKQSYYHYIHDESERLSRLISNVLQLANISRSDPQLEMVAMPVGELLKDIKPKLKDQTTRADFELVFDIDPESEHALINVDKDCFTQVIINLVDNAIKFSRKAINKKIVISSHQAKPDKITISVRDYGPGIPIDQHRKIFDMFYRSENELTRETTGTGIGLAIVKQMSEAMSATVNLVNHNPGAEFQIIFTTE